MEDSRIIELFRARSEDAIANLSEKYGAYCRTVAFRILNDELDTEECLSDTWLKTWDSIPPAEPKSLRAYVAKICRNLALDRFDRERAAKRGGGEVLLALDELSDCISGGDTVSKAVEDEELVNVLNAFLAGLPAEKRKVFVRRYWYMDSVAEIAEAYGFSESKVKTQLLRTRKELGEKLEKEGIQI